MAKSKIRNLVQPDGAWLTKSSYLTTVFPNKGNQKMFLSNRTFVQKFQQTTNQNRSSSLDNDYRGHHYQLIVNRNHRNINNANYFRFPLLTAIFLLWLSMLNVVSIPTVQCDQKLSLTSSQSSLSSSSSSSSSNTYITPSPLTSVNFRCPEQFGYYADEYNCSKYFVCVFGEALHESCTGGLRFSSELQTCDWPRNVVCPLEEDLAECLREFDLSVTNLYLQNALELSTNAQLSHLHAKDLESNFDDDGNDVSSQNKQQQSKSTGSGFVVESATLGPDQIFDGYVKEIKNNAAAVANDKSSRLVSSAYYSPTTTPPTVTTFQTEETSGEQINEAVLLQQSFDKLVKKTRFNQKHYSKSQSHSRPYITSYNVDKNNDGSDISFVGLSGSNDINSNKLDNGTLDSDMPVEDLDENFTLVDLQRSPINLVRNKAKTRNTNNNNDELQKGYNDNILGTVGRSVNGGRNRAQSVSVIASTSSEAMIPELEFVFKNQGMSSNSKGNNAHANNGNNHNKPNLNNNNRNRITLDDVLQINDYSDGSGGNSGQSGKYMDDSLTATVDENGAIHIDGDDGSSLLRIIGPLSKNSDDSKNSLPGTAASNRNTASQQVIVVKNFQDESLDVEGKLLFETGQRQAKRPNLIKSIVDGDNADAKTLKTGTGTILVFNRTQLSSITGIDSLTGANINSTFILIDHQQPVIQQHDPQLETGNFRNSDDSLHDDTEEDDLKLGHRLTDRPRQPIIIRASKEDSDLVELTKHSHRSSNARVRSFGGYPPPTIATTTTTTSSRSGSSIGNQNRTGLLIGSKERSKPAKYSNVSPSITTSQHRDKSNNNDNIAILVSMDNSDPSGELDDFQRIRTGKNIRRLNTTTETLEVAAINEPGLRQIQYFTDQSQPNNSGNKLTNSTVHRPAHNRHVGSHHRHAGLSNNDKSAQNITAGGGNRNNLHKNLTLQIPSRSASVYSTPEPFSTAEKCDEQVCRLPDCFCGGTEIPNGLPIKDVPQLVLISFDDAVNDVNWHIYEELLNSGRSNPNGCPIKATFYVSHEWTDYSQIQTLYSRGHEIASHSITHSFGERFTKQQWHKEVAGQREILHQYGGVNRADIRGMRAPFLQAGGNKQFEMLHEDNFTYDSSMPVFENSPPFWPYTLDYTINHECMIAPCPTKSFPGLWEIGLVMWQDLRDGRCSMGDACSNPSDEDGIYELIMKNFKRHYNSNRAPFGLYYHSAWFNNEHHRRGFLRVIDDLLTYYKDVYFVTKWELIQWIRNPTPLKELYRVNLFGCSRDPNRPPPCLHPNICNVGSHSGARYLKTCQPCPKRYPWLGDTGR